MGLGQTFQTRRERNNIGMTIAPFGILHAPQQSPGPWCRLAVLTLGVRIHDHVVNETTGWHRSVADFPAFLHLVQECFGLFRGLWTMITVVPRLGLLLLLSCSILFILFVVARLNPTLQKRVVGIRVRCNGGLSSTATFVVHVLEQLE